MDRSYSSVPRGSQGHKIRYAAGCTCSRYATSCTKQTCALASKVIIAHYDEHARALEQVLACLRSLVLLSPDGLVDGHLRERWVLLLKNLEHLVLRRQLCSAAAIRSPVQCIEAGDKQNDGHTTSARIRRS